MAGNDVTQSEFNSTVTVATPDIKLERLILDKINDKEFNILIPSFILAVVIISIGVPGNVITIFVYKKKMRRTASRIFILALAICDLVNCILTIPLEISIILSFWTYDYPIICAIGRTLTYVLNGTSALLLCGIAVDRFRKICRPLKPVFTPQKTMSICVVSSAIGFAFYIPGYIMYGTYSHVITVPYGSTNLTVELKTCQIKDAYVKVKAPKIIFGVWFLGTIVILFILIGAYIFIGRAVYKRLKLEEKRHNSVSAASKSARARQVVVEDNSETSCSFEDILDIGNKQPRVLKSMSLPMRQQISQTMKKKFRQSAPTVYSIKQEKVAGRIRAGRTTLMLFSVTIAYVLTFIPFIVIVVIRTVRPNLYETLSDTEKSAWNFFLRSYVLNFAMNPILYGFFNKDFRKKMVELLCECGS